MSSQTIVAQLPFKSRSTILMGREDITGTANAIAGVLDREAFFPPVGSITPFAGASAPARYLLCDGSAVSRYGDTAALFKIIGTIYGAGNGTSTFNLPNLKGRVPVGLNSADTEFDTLGETGGTKTHVLTIPQLPVHNHGTQGVVPNNNLTSDDTHTHSTTEVHVSVTDHTHTYSQSNDGGDAALPTGGPANDGVFTGTTSGANPPVTATAYVDPSGSHHHTLLPQGGNQPHNNIQPYLTVNYIIRYI